MGGSDLGRMVDNLVMSMFAVVAVSVPLAIWKIVDIIVWIIQHINISVGVH